MPQGPVALVVGDVDLVRALGLAGIPVVLATTTRYTTAAFSRYCVGVARVPSCTVDPHGFVEALTTEARRIGRVVLYTQGDDDTLAVSRLRHRLGPEITLPLADDALIAAMIDKESFHELAVRCHLPVPETRIVDADQAGTDALADWSQFPCVVKPALRTRWFGSSLATSQGPSRKALRIADRASLDALLDQLAAHGGRFLIQASVEGDESAVCSHHAYVRADGTIVGEFTGQKIRTWATEHGVSSAVRITRDPDVTRLGRKVLEGLGLTGVVKCDFKRDVRDGRLRLLEVNPRFNLWHHPGAIAGVNLPALVWRDALAPGSASSGPARDGVSWISIARDWRAMRAYRARGEIRLRDWLPQVANAEAWQEGGWRDPLPGAWSLAGEAARTLLRR